MFRRKAILPIDNDIEVPNTEYLLNKLKDDTDGHEKATDILILYRHHMLQKEKGNTAQEQKTQKEQYDRMHANPKPFKDGAKVLMKDFKRKK